MPSRFPLFDRSRLRLSPLAEREHLLDLGIIRPLEPTGDVHPNLRRAAAAIRVARERGAPVIFMMGAHVIRSGVQPYLIDLMERGLVTGLAGNGACAIHDFELARLGATTESVVRYISEGRFGLWLELEEINLAYRRAAAEGLGAGEGLGRLIAESGCPHREISLFYAAHRLNIPFTIHLGIGQDITHELPECDGAALGQASYTDFLILARQIEDLEGGLFAGFGSAVTAPEVFLKALAMARNAARPGLGPRRFSTLVSDLHDLPDGIAAEAPESQALYYYRPWKTLLVRTVADGGRAWYVKGRHQRVIPELWTALTEKP